MSVFTASSYHKDDKTMKLTLVIFILFVVRWQVECRVVKLAEESKRLTPEGEACVGELNLNRGKILAVNWFVDVLPEDDYDFTQFMGCLTGKLGLMKSNGEMDFDKIKEAFLSPARADSSSEPGFFKLYKQIVTDSVENCQRESPKGSTQGGTALKTLNCVAVKMKETVEH